MTKIVFSIEQRVNVKNHGFDDLLFYNVHTPLTYIIGLQENDGLCGSDI